MKTINRNYCYIFKMKKTWHAITACRELGRFTSFEGAFHWCKLMGYNMEELKRSRKKPYAFIEYNATRDKVKVTVLNKRNEPVELGQFKSIPQAYLYVVDQGYYAVIIAWKEEAII